MSGEDKALAFAESIGSAVLDYVEETYMAAISPDAYEGPEDC